MSITRISQSSIKEGLEKYNSFIAGLPGVIGSYESIQTITVGSGGSANVEFTSIPSTYQHLQIRGICKDSGGTTLYSGTMRFNGDTGSNYSTHYLQGTGSAAQASGYSSQTGIWVPQEPAGNATYFAPFVIDILDYSSTSKNTTVRAFEGNDQNASHAYEWVDLASGAWFSTSAVTSIKIIAAFTAWAQHSTFALYGIKAP